MQISKYLIKNLHVWCETNQLFCNSPLIYHRLMPHRSSPMRSYSWDIVQEIVACGFSHVWTRSDCRWLLLTSVFCYCNSLKRWIDYPTMIWIDFVNQQLSNNLIIVGEFVSNNHEPTIWQQFMLCTGWSSKGWLMATFTSGRCTRVGHRCLGFGAAHCGCGGASVGDAESWNEPGKIGSQNYIRSSVCMWLHDVACVIYRHESKGR